MKDDCYIKNSCDILSLEESYQGTFLEHAFSKAYQYVVKNEILCKNLTYVSIKTSQGDL